MFRDTYIWFSLLFPLHKLLQYKNLPSLGKYDQSRFYFYQDTSVIDGHPHMNGIRTEMCFHSVRALAYYQFCFFLSSLSFCLLPVCCTSYGGKPTYTEQWKDTKCGRCCDLGNNFINNRRAACFLQHLREEKIHETSHYFCHAVSALLLNFTTFWNKAEHRGPANKTVSMQ